MSATYRSILLDKTTDLELAEKGYTIFPLLDAAATGQLKNYYAQFQKEQPQHFYASTHSPDMAFRRRTSDFIRALIAPSLPALLCDYQLLGGAYVVKPANGKGILQPHQDWNIVDERTGRSYNIWIPLVDVNPENGVVFVLPSSHNKIQTVRGPGIPWPYKDFEALIWKDMLPLNMKAGEALLYDHALIHGSPPNQTEQARLGIVCGIIPSGSLMRFYNWNGASIDVYDSNGDFFLDHNPQDCAAVLNKIETLAVPSVKMDEAAFKRLYLKPADSVLNQQRPNFFRNLLSKLKP